MVQDKKKFSSGKTADTSKNVDRKAQSHIPDRDTARPGSMKDQNLSKDKDIASKRERDLHSRK